MNVSGLSAASAIGVLFFAMPASPSSAQCRQFGGARQDFKVECRKLAYEWPEEGPPILWSRELGEGYTAVLADGDSLYATYRKSGRDHVAALRAKNGETTWDFEFDAPAHAKHVNDFNAGPRATPALDDGRLFFINCAGVFHCVDAMSGKVIWRHDLWTEFKDATFLNHGYSASPFVYKDTVIAVVGGKGHAVVAFDAKSGNIKWQKHDFDASYATPKLIELDGRPQLLCFMAKELIAIDPANGDLFWEFKHGNGYGQNISMPVWGDDHILFISSIEQGGTRALKLTQKGDKTEVEELWHNRRVRIHHQNAIRIGNHVYASTGDPNIWQAIDIHTGEVCWRERGFAKSNAIYADGQFIVIDEEGHLGLATACPEFFEIREKVPLLGSRAWTVPTLVGTTLYVRDNEKLVAVDLSAKS